MAPLEIHSWEDQVEECCTPPDKAVEVVQKAFASFVYPERGGAPTGRVMRGYPNSTRPREALWVGVPSSSEYRELAPGWMAWGRANSPTNRYFGSVVPSEDGREVQLGFTSIRLDQANEYLRLKFGGDPGLPRVIRVSARANSPFRIDKVVAVLARMAEEDTLKDSIGSVILSELLDDVGRTCYSEGAVNVLDNRDPKYRAMMRGVLDRMAPGWDTPKDSTALKTLVRVAGLNVPGDCELLWPFCFIFMVPRPISEKIQECLAQNIPPLVPNWVSRNCHQFNQRWSSPCPGEVKANSADLLSTKLFGGVTNKFNFDAPGGTNRCYMTIPQEWIDHYCQVVDEFIKKDKPLGTAERGDMALGYARRIPTVVECTGGLSYYRVKNVHTPKMCAYETDVLGGVLNPGDETEGEAPPVPPAEVCLCGRTLPPRADPYICGEPECGAEMCGSCDIYCTRCGGYFCLNHRREHTLGGRTCR